MYNYTLGLGSTRTFTKITQKSSIEYCYSIYKVHILQLQEEPFHFLIRFLNTFKFSADYDMVRQIIPNFWT